MVSLAAGATSTSSASSTTCSSIGTPRTPYQGRASTGCTEGSVALRYDVGVQLRAGRMGGETVTTSPFKDGGNEVAGGSISERLRLSLERHRVIGRRSRDREHGFISSEAVGRGVSGFFGLRPNTNGIDVGYSSRPSVVAYKKLGGNFSPMQFRRTTACMEELERSFFEYIQGRYNKHCQFHLAPPFLQAARTSQCSSGKSV